MYKCECTYNLHLVAVNSVQVADVAFTKEEKPLVYVSSVVCGTKDVGILHIQLPRGYVLRFTCNRISSQATSKRIDVFSTGFHLSKLIHYRSAFEYVHGRIPSGHGE